MRVDEFDFPLPKDRIAQAPARPRDSARLLHVGADLADRRVRDLPDLLHPGDLLVMNDTRVIPARLRGVRTAARGEAGIEITLHRQVTCEDDARTRWLAFARPGKRLRPGDTVRCSGLPDATVLEKRESGDFLLAFDAGAAGVLDALDGAGEMPLPPYIARNAARPEDRVDYQTVYARERGAVAAPTAGLHFTDRTAGSAGRARCRPCLRHPACRRRHLPAGQGRPGGGPQDACRNRHGVGGNGATDRRGAGVRRPDRRRRHHQPALLESSVDDRGRICPFAGDTDIFIVPGSPVRSADLLLTNFHLPRSTLFMLVCAFAGTARMKAAYAHAIDSGYRFYSYGDACLLERAQGDRGETGGETGP